jgi:pSer/pThr/pTyr-binding forkhead associated (FHA) protein
MRRQRVHLYVLLKNVDNNVLFRLQFISCLIVKMSDVSYNTQSLAALQAISSSPKEASFGHIVLQMKDGSAGPPYPLEERRYLIGRQSYCDIRVQAPTVSREHAQIQVDDNDHVWLVNLSQNNPVKVNGVVHLARVQLSNGDQFTIGERIFTFERQQTSAVEQTVSTAMSSKYKSPELKTPLGETKQSHSEPDLAFKFSKSPAALNFDDCGDKEVIFSPPQQSPHASKACPHRKLPSAIKNQLQGKIGLSCIMSPKMTKSSQKRERVSIEQAQNDENEHNIMESQANELSNQEQISDQKRSRTFPKTAGVATPGMDLDTAAAVQQLFTLTPAAAASQGATPKAKSSAKAAGVATPGMDLDTAAAVQQLFTLTPAVAASQGATPKAKSSVKASYSFSNDIFVTSTPSNSICFTAGPLSEASVLSDCVSPVASCFLKSFASPIGVDQFSEPMMCPPSKRKSILKDLTTPSKRKSVCIRPDMNEVALIVDFKVDAPVEIVRTPRIQRKHIDAFRKTKRCRVATPGSMPDLSPAVQASARPQRQSKRQCTFATPTSIHHLDFKRSSFSSPITENIKNHSATSAKAVASPAKPVPTPVADAVAAEPAGDLSALKIVELRDLCKSKGLSTSGKKEELVARLSESVVPEIVAEAATIATPAKAVASPAKPVPTPVADAVAAEPAGDLSALKIVELRDLCKSKGLSTSGKKEELIDRLRLV